MQEQESDTQKGIQAPGVEIRKAEHDGIYSR